MRPEMLKPIGRLPGRLIPLEKKTDHLSPEVIKDAAERVLLAAFGTVRLDSWRVAR